jgi:hypothetical protein
LHPAGRIAICSESCAGRDVGRSRRRDVAAPPPTGPIERWRAIVRRRPQPRTADACGHASLAALYARVHGEPLARRLLKT